MHTKMHQLNYFLQLQGPVKSCPRCHFLFAEVFVQPRSMSPPNVLPPSFCAANCFNRFVVVQDESFFLKRAIT